MPDGNWATNLLQVVDKTKWWTLAGLTCACIVILVFSEYSLLSLGLLAPLVRAVIAVIGITSGCLVVFRVVKGISAWSRGAIVRVRAGKVKRRFGKLSKVQQEWLIVNSSHGSRHFIAPDALTRFRWFEELMEWNYIKCEERMVFVWEDDGTCRISFTMAGVA